MALVICLFWAIKANHWFPMGIWVIAEAAMILAYSENTKFVEEAMRDYHRQNRQKLSESIENKLLGLDLETRLRIKAICRIEQDVSDLAHSADNGEIQEAVSAILELIEQIVDKAFGLATKKRNLQRFIDSIDEKTLNQQITDLKNKVEKSEDDSICSLYEHSLRAKQQEAEDFLAIKRSVSQIDVEIENIECVLSGIKSRVVRLYASEGADWHKVGQEIEKQLEQIITGIETTENAVNELLKV